MIVNKWIDQAKMIAALFFQFVLRRAEDHSSVVFYYNNSAGPFRLEMKQWATTNDRI